GEIDVVARRPSRAVGALLGLDRDRERRAHRLAQLAGDAALLAVGIAAQRMQAAEARALRRFFLGILDGHLALKKIAAGEPQALEELDQEKRAEEFPRALEHRRPSERAGQIGSASSRPGRRSRRSSPG